MNKQYSINEYIDKKSEIVRLLKDSMHSIDDKDISELSYFIYFDLGFSLNEEKQVIVLKNYLEHWAGRNIQTHLKNFSLPFEKTILKLLANNQECLKEFDYSYTSNELTNYLKIITNAKHEPSIVNFLEYDCQKVNLSFIKTLLTLITNLVISIEKNYEKCEVIKMFEDLYTKLKTKNKYLVQSIEKFDFVFENNKYLEKEHKKLKLFPEDIKPFVTDLLKITDYFCFACLKQVNSILDMR